MTDLLSQANKQLGTNYIDWRIVSTHQKLSEDFIREFKDEVEWYVISSYQKLSEDFIREFRDNVYWRFISTYQKLSEDFIREFKDEVDWFYISTHQKLSEDFIREFKDEVNWCVMSIYQKLSEDFIREFKDEVDWYCISAYQKLSEDFIREFKDAVNWYCISKCQKLSEDFIREFEDKIVSYPDSCSWLYKTKAEKKELIKNLPYDQDDDYVYAYKGIRSDNYSKCNFQYQYFVGDTYQNHCNCDPVDENSFGLSAWTLKAAKDYCNEKIIKVKIAIENIGCVVHNGNKIRCFEFEVLEEI